MGRGRRRVGRRTHLELGLPPAHALLPPCDHLFEVARGDREFVAPVFGAGGDVLLVQPGARRRRLDPVLEVLVEGLEHEQRGVRRDDAVTTRKLEDLGMIRIDDGERAGLTAGPGPCDEASLDRPFARDREVIGRGAGSGETELPELRR